MIAMVVQIRQPKRVMVIIKLYNLTVALSICSTIDAQSSVDLTSMEGVSANSSLDMVGCLS